MLICGRIVNLIATLAMQVNYPYAIALDWLTLFVEWATSFDELKERKTSRFIITQRPYGSKMWRKIFNIEVTDDNGVIIPFGQACCEPTTKGIDPLCGTLKIDNALLYTDMWRPLLDAWIDETYMLIKSISRCDIALDFLFLKHRVTGRQLVDNLLTYKWWKCGRTEYNVYASMPYSIKWTRNIQDQVIDEIFTTDGNLSNRAQSITFGKASSPAQICIYDKTAELKTTEVDGISNKEYIRQWHKANGVWDERRHTWRIEIRLNSRSYTLARAGKTELSPLCLDDIMPNNIAETFRAAQDTWFRLVDATEGGKHNITTQYLKSLHKARLPRVDIWPEVMLKPKFVRRMNQPQLSRFYKACANKCANVANDITSGKISVHGEYDSSLLKATAETMFNLAKVQSISDQVELHNFLINERNREILVLNNYAESIKKEDGIDLSNMINKEDNLANTD